MDEVYEFARTIDMAQQWQRGSKLSPAYELVDFIDAKSRPEKAKKASKDLDALSWGRAKEGERNIYRKNDR